MLIKPSDTEAHVGRALQKRGMLLKQDISNIKREVI